MKTLIDDNITISDLVTIRDMLQVSTAYELTQLSEFLLAHNKKEFDKKITEESLELALAYIHFKDNKISKEMLACELSDTLIQITKLISIDGELNKMVTKKYKETIENLASMVYGA